MTNRDLLKEIRNENKAINRNIQRLINIGLLGPFWKDRARGKRER